MLSQYATNLLRSTCCHSVDLTKNGKSYTGIYNGLASWGRVEDGAGNLVEELYAEFDEDENEHYDFTLSDFIEAGYTVI